MPATALVVLTDGFEETEAVTTIDLLRRAGVSVTTAGLTGTMVTGAHEIVVTADCTFDPTDESYDAMVLPGGPGTSSLAAHEPLLRAIRSACDQGRLCAAICAAPTVLAKAGILEQKTATCYPGFEKDLHGAVVSQEPVVVDGNVITSRGVGTAIPFALALIRYLVDEKTAARVGVKVLHRAL